MEGQGTSIVMTYSKQSSPNACDWCVPGVFHKMRKDLSTPRDDHTSPHRSICYSLRAIKGVHILVSLFQVREERKYAGICSFIAIGNKQRVTDQKGVSRFFDIFTCFA